MRAVFPIARAENRFGIQLIRISNDNKTITLLLFPGWRIFSVITVRGVRERAITDLRDFSTYGPRARSAR